MIVALILAAGVTYTQAEETLMMSGTETLDPNEQISGNAIVGVRFHDRPAEFDLNQLHVYFPAKPPVKLNTTLTTVDGRYHFVGELDPVPDNIEANSWRPLTLRNSKDDTPLDEEFLGRYFNHGEIALLVSDDCGRVYPALWGKDRSKSTLEVIVNAEGADAYYVRKTANGPELVRCDTTGRHSKFKFDHYCEMRWDDATEMAKQDDKGEYKFPIIRKRGATYEPSLNVKLASSDEQHNCPSN